MQHDQAGWSLRFRNRSADKLAPGVGVGEAQVQGDLDHPPIIITGARWKTLVRAALALVWVLLVAAFIGEKLALPMLAAALVGTALLLALGAVVFELLRPNRLEISPAGLTCRVYWRTHRYGWNDVVEFVPIKRRLLSYVGLNFSPDYPKRRGRRRFAAEAMGAEASLPLGWTLDATALAGLLTAARARWVTGAPAPAAPPAPSAGGWLNGGRMSRATFWKAQLFWLVAGVIAGLGTSLALRRPEGAIAGLILATRVQLTGRLHDIGWSGWWSVVVWFAQLAAFFGGFVLFLAVPAADPAAGLLLAFGGAGLIHLAVVLLVGLAPGTAGPNRFGPVPGTPSDGVRASVFE
jgi:uncharacterized membrane protein YhaH (DUF805 family)